MIKWLKIANVCDSYIGFVDSEEDRYLVSLPEFRSLLLKIDENNSNPDLPKQSLHGFTAEFESLPNTLYGYPIIQNIKLIGYGYSNH